MSVKRLVVIGASAGGIEALRTLVGGLPETFAVPICVAVHTSPAAPGVVPQILERAGRRRAVAAYDGLRLDGGRIYVAPPDRHLLIEPGRLRVTKGPREHGFRPAVDPLFRSAAQVFGPAATGIVLSGNLDDGTAGLWTIKKLGGTAIVQDPSDALYPSMPLNAQRHVPIDYSLPVSLIPSLLVELLKDPKMPEPVPVPTLVDLDVNIAKEQDPRAAGLEQIGKPSPYACPDCHGVLLELAEGGRVRFRAQTAQPARRPRECGRHPIWPSAGPRRCAT
jgi:two-component system chemotaxis response regulator CheB